MGENTTLVYLILIGVTMLVAGLVFSGQFDLQGYLFFGGIN